MAPRTISEEYEERRRIEEIKLYLVVTALFKKRIGEALEEEFNEYCQKYYAGEAWPRRTPPR